MLNSVFRTSLASVVTLLTVSVSSISFAQTIDTQNCPQSIPVSISKVEPFKSSIYSKTPGWKEANSVLQTYAGGEFRFELSSRGPNSCRYTDVNGAKAVLMMVSSFDPEDGRTYHNEQLLVQFEIDGVEFTMFPGVVDYTASSIKVSAGRSKVRTKLLNPQGKSWNYDVGHADIRAL